ncbi:MAG: MaoC family dehydratase N-terminal domain-containing protein [Actinobacteria bacterium]|nr:MaoC family dehydratase N-terminal domain-containing protein [Actinomycetota bacterium]MCL6104508.1 MaoC family dehydratase N-terminal domain-containing protein [Actinomycetota bacterium]
MALAVEKLGTVYPEKVEVIDPNRAKAYALATNDDIPAYLEGKYAPPVFGVVAAWSGLGYAVGDVVPAESLLMLVHGEHDMHFSRPLIPGRSLTTQAEAFSIRVSPTGSRYTIKLTSHDTEDGGLVLTQYGTMFIRQVSDGSSGGPDKPDHTFGQGLRSNPIGTFTVHVDQDQTQRYADASGDRNPIHLDEAVAKSVGLPGIILHGLCTMAMTSQAVLKLAADQDPQRLARLAVRFAKFVLPGNDVATTLYDAGSSGGIHSYAFEAKSADQTVIKNGWAEIKV